MKRVAPRLAGVVLAAFLTASVVLISSPVSVHAQASAEFGHCNNNFLTFPAWYNGVNKASSEKDDKGNTVNDCEIASPSEVGGFGVFIWRIALNLVEIMLNAVGYLSVGFIIYGGIKYIYSAGSPDGMVSARKTIFNAIIGLVISIVSVAIVNTIAGGLS